MSFPCYPLTFDSIFQERIWGGQNLARLFQKRLPADRPIGESWEISDRPDAVSVVNQGPLAGKSLRWLMENHGADIVGPGTPAGSRFPLLIKILDAQQTLSLQVHPPAKIAEKLDGEPKTEMWYVAEASDAAAFYVGLKQGTTRSMFEAMCHDGTVAECFHQIHVTAGDVMFLPSGRVHALGAGSVIFEIQQNSDTTYRVFDWNRVGTDGNPRELHLEESLQSIDFTDIEPKLVNAPAVPNPAVPRILQRTLVNGPPFHARLMTLPPGSGAERLDLPLDHSCQIVAVTAGEIELTSPSNIPFWSPRTLGPGKFALLPAALGTCTVSLTAGSTILTANPVAIA